MGTIKENKLYYDNYDWLHTGEQWAGRWGGSDVQWYGTILQRIHAFLPVATALEIGAGHGRLAGYLEHHCDHLVLVDMTKDCIDACTKRFAGNRKVTCVHNDGLGLSSVEDESIDFVFSFFSLVHADDATLRSYLVSIAEKLSRDGVAFIHHSNAGTCLSGGEAEDARLHDYRDTTVSADIMAKLTKEVGLTCRSQELFGWETAKLLTDCFTVFTRPGSKFEKPNRVVCNWDFPFEVEKLNQLAEAYGVVSHTS